LFCGLVVALQSLAYVRATLHHLSIEPVFLPARESSRLLKNVILLYYFLFSDKIRIKVRPNPLTVATGR